MNHLSVDSEADYYFDYNNSINPNLPYSILNTSSLRLNRTFVGPYIASEAQVDSVTSDLIAKVMFTYDSKFRHSKITITDSANSIAYTPYFFYDKDSNLRQAGDLSIKREANQGLISELKLGKAQINYSFDPDYGELSKIEYRFNGVVGLLQNFKRDKLGRISQMSYESGESIIHYDEAGRFTGRSQVGTNKPFSSFIYDKNGNRIRGYEDERTFTAEYDNQDRLIKYNKTSYGYTLNGDRSWKQEGSKYTNYTFDAFGNLTQVQLPEKQIQYLYDGLNRRIAKKEWGTLTTRFIWQDQLRVAAELNANGTFRKQFIYADTVNSPEYMFYNGKKYLFVKDHRGSILQVVDSATGEIMQKMKYSEFGEVLLDTNPGFQPFGFAGGFYDYETKLVRFGARDYDGSAGRWMSKDPILFRGKSKNLYSYVENDPLNLVDSKGLFSSSGNSPKAKCQQDTLDRYYNNHQNNDPKCEQKLKTEMDSCEGYSDKEPGTEEIEAEQKRIDDLLKDPRNDL